MEKVFQNVWKFVKENKMRFFSSVVFSLLIVYMLYFLKCTPVFDVDRQASFYIKLIEIFYYFPIIEKLFNIVGITIFCIIIYLILFGKRKVDLKKNWSKILINMGVIILITALDTVFYRVIEMGFNAGYLYINILFGGLELIKETFEYNSIFYIIFGMISGLIVNFIFAIIYFTKISAFLSIFMILENKCESQLSVVEIWKHFSKTVSKKVLIFISFLYIEIKKIFFAFNWNLFLQRQEEWMPSVVGDKIFYKVIQHFNINGFMKFPIIFITIGFILLFILLVEIIRLDEKDYIAEVLKGKNLKFYLKIFGLVASVGGVLFLFFIKISNDILQNNYYYSYSYAITKVLPIIILAIFAFPSLLIILDMLLTKIYFQYLGKDITLSIKKFFRIVFHLLLQNIVIIFIYFIFMKIILAVIYNDSISEIIFKWLVVITFIVVYLCNFYFLVLFSKFQILEILNSDGITAKEVIKNSLRYVKKFFNVKVGIHLFILIMSEFTMSDMPISLHSTLLYGFNKIVNYVVIFIFMQYFMLYFINYYLKLKNEEKNLKFEEYLTYKDKRISEK